MFAEFECCGVVNGNEYGTSWWSLRELSLPGLRVPLSCCVQTSIGSSRDPQPLNNTACQNPKFEMHNLSRHMEISKSLSQFIVNIDKCLQLSGLLFHDRLYLACLDGWLSANALFAT
uniref:Uncharacterized protein n=1 Tax=Rhodnius prolixus TaxID=13249 RepID=T1HWW6_RHOPR